MVMDKIMLKAMVMVEDMKGKEESEAGGTEDGR
jgi:hypothetical protein